MRRILYVDGEEYLRGIVSLVFEDAGYQVHTAPDAKRALKMYRKLKPDLVWTYSNLPLVSGVELTRRIREIDPKARVVIEFPHKYFLEEADEVKPNRAVVRLEIDKYLRNGSKGNDLSLKDAMIKLAEEVMQET